MSLLVTSSNSEYSHDTDDSRVDRNDARADFLQGDPDHRHDDDEDVQLIPAVYHPTNVSNIDNTAGTRRNITGGTR